MKQIIVINGVGGTGKDTFINACSKFISVVSVSSVERVKTAAEILGWNGRKTEKDRKFLSDLKVLSSKYNDMPYEDIKRKIHKFYNSNYEIMFIKLREPLEIKRLVMEYNAKTLLLHRNNVKLIKSNFADKNVENYNYDYVIEISSMDKLDNQAIDFINKIRK